MNETKPIYPGFPLSAAGIPRVALMGHLEPLSGHVPKDAEEAVGKCYLGVHPDAHAWAPHNKDSPHSSYWAIMVVDQAYWFGGFGDVQRIGWMNVTEWKGIREDKSLDGIGDGRGWGDVRLPGEKE